jgi:L-serine dehydratase
MTISTFDLFKIGIGPSSSHTVGPMRAALAFIEEAENQNILSQIHRIKVELFGSLGATGKGHGSPKAVILGLEGETPECVNVSLIAQRMEDLNKNKTISLAGKHQIKFSRKQDLILYRRKSLPYHPNGMTVNAFDSQGNTLLAKVYYSVGGGFVVDEKHADDDSPLIEHTSKLPFHFTTGTKLLELCKQHSMSISQIMWENEKTWRPEQETRQELLNIWRVMQESVHCGTHSVDEILPGGLKVPRRAPALYKKLMIRPESALSDPLTVLDWVSMYALAVNEENAAGGRIVTAPTNGAAGIIPAVMHYYERFTPNVNEDGIVNFLLVAAAIGILYKENASISGAEVGCQGEVGSACSMAAGALAEVLGGTPDQVENAAEIGMEHNLGLTCDPIGGLVQVPCIERNAMASIKAISAARMALRGNGNHFVSLDNVIKTMKDTGHEMNNKYKETSRGGLAVNVVEMPVNIVEC